MAKLMLNVPITVEVRDGKKKENLKVEVRDLTKKEQKESQGLVKQFEELSYKIDRASSKLESAKKKSEYSEKLEKFSDAIKYQERADAIELELEEIVKEVNTLGGGDFNEEMAKKNFDRLVTGADVERLAEIANSKGYSVVMPMLYKAKRDVEGKQESE